MTRTLFSATYRSLSVHKNGSNSKHKLRCHHLNYFANITLNFFSLELLCVSCTVTFRKIIQLNYLVFPVISMGHTRGVPGSLVQPRKHSVNSLCSTAAKQPDLCKDTQGLDSLWFSGWSAVCIFHQGAMLCTNILAAHEALLHSPTSTKTCEISLRLHVSSTCDKYVSQSHLPSLVQHLQEETGCSRELENSQINAKTFLLEANYYLYRFQEVPVSPHQNEPCWHPA